MIDILIDGGTTNLRVYALDPRTGAVLAQAKAEGGVKYTAIDGHTGRLKQLLRDCIAEVLARAAATPADVRTCVAYGMITSGMGLCEIPHLAAPVEADDLCRGMRTATFADVAPFPIRFIPGVRNFAGTVELANCGGMDMMRGEETEAIGLYHLLALETPALFVLPGSHNKFVSMDAGGRILGCMTSISGELLDAVTHHTILAGTVEQRFCAPEEYDSDIACAAACQCMDSGIGRAAFSGRILHTLGGYTAGQVRSWLLGAVLAEDIRAMCAFVADIRAVRICVAGKQPLQRAFVDVLQAVCSVTALPVDEQLSAMMGIRGAMEIARHA